MGPRTLCNACGLLYAKLTKRKQQEAEAAAKASGKTAEEIVREREESPGAKQASLEALRAELNLVNGLRNRSTSSSAPLGDATVFEAPSSRFQDEGYYEPASSRPWSGRYPDDAQPFAHQPPSHRAAMDPSRSTSLGQADNFHALSTRPMEPSAGPSASRAPFLPMANTRPYTGGAAAPSLPLPLNPGRQRSSTLQPPATHGYGSSSSEAHRRHHPYM
uniref:GATA-type domain-containing protein n=2 Tax=Kalmanozyma brasiliensis (strain GHG001) TaxID=1365824 RepID=V5E3B7_KALBG